MATQTKAAPINFFSEAAATEKVTASKKEVKKIAVTGLEQDMLRYNAIKIDESNLATEKEMLRSKIIPIGKREWFKELRLNRSRPDSFQLIEGAGKIMFIIEDAYKKVEPVKAAALQSYKDVLETKTIWKINSEILAKPGIAEALSAAIQNLKLSDEDKAVLIKGEKVTAIKKGTIDRLITYENYETLFDIIEPTIALK